MSDKRITYGLPDNYRFLTRYNLTELGWPLRVVLIVLTFLITFGTLIALIIIPYKLNLPREGTQPLSEVPNGVTLLSLFFVGFVLPQTLPAQYKLSILRLMKGQPSLGWAYIARRKIGYLDAYDPHLYFTKLQFAVVNVLPNLLMVTIMVGLLIIGPSYIFLSVLGGLTTKSINSTFPLINVVRALRQPRGSRICETGCGTIEVYVRADA